MKKLEDKSINEIYNTALDDVLWINYNDETELIKRANYLDTYGFVEYDLYIRMINNICDYISRNMSEANVFTVCGFLTSLIYQHDDWLIGEKPFLYTESSIDSENFNIYGLEVIRGKGCCRHTASFIYDVLLRLGYDVYKITASISNSNATQVDFLNYICDSNYYLPSIHKKTDYCNNDHMVILCKYMSKYYLYDSTYGLISAVQNCRGIEVDNKVEYTLGIQSLYRYNYLLLCEFKDMIDELYNSKVSKLINLNQLNDCLYDGAEEAQKVDNDTIRIHLSLYKRLLNCNKLKQEYIHENVLRKI